MVHDPLAFETGNIVSAIPQLTEDGGVVCAKQRRQLADASGGAVELGRRARLPHPAKRQALILFEDVIGLYLPVLEEVKTAQDQSGWNVVAE